MPSSHEVITRIPKAGDISHYRYQKGIVEYMGIVAVEVNLRDVLQDRIDEFVTMVREKTLNAGLLCSDTNNPFVINVTHALTVAHGVEHLAGINSLKHFKNGRGKTSERGRRSRDREGDFWIEIHIFKPNPLIIFPQYKIPGYIALAIDETNTFFKSK
jgi:hypothetical protein